MTASRGIRAKRGTRQLWAEEQQGKHSCECGCGGVIPVQPVHFPQVPRFLHGHNTKGKVRKPKPPAIPCACGCGQDAAPGKRYISGHNSKGRKLSAASRRRIAEAHTGERSHRYGKRPANWKGGRTRTTHGYIWVWTPGHPYGVGTREGYVFEHRLLMEQHLRETDPTSPFLKDGYLHPSADVHHVNEVKDDNQIANLQVMWRGAHTRHHLDLRPSVFPDEWFDGDEHTLELGVDMRSTCYANARAQLSRVANKRGLRTKGTRLSETVFTFRAF